MLVSTSSTPLPARAPQKDSASSLFSEDDILDVLYRATRLFKAELSRQPEAIAYAKSRAITGALAARWHLGYAPDQFDFLKKRINNDALLHAAGLAKQSERGRYYDAFRGRLMFPVRNRNGDVVGFGGRRLVDDPALGPKYLNSDASAVFEKGSLLYGERFLADEGDAIALIVEGYLDVLAIDRVQHQSASLLTHATVPLAPMGTSLTQAQASRIVTSNAVKDCRLWFDDDAAGKKATLRSIPILLSAMAEHARELPLSVLSVVADHGDDPASILQHETIRACELVDWADYLVASLPESCGRGAEAHSLNVVETELWLNKVLFEQLGTKARARAALRLDEALGLPLGTIAPSTR